MHNGVVRVQPDAHGLPGLELEHIPQAVIAQKQSQGPFQKKQEKPQDNENKSQTPQRATSRKDSSENFAHNEPRGGRVAPTRPIITRPGKNRRGGKKRPGCRQEKTRVS